MARLVWMDRLRGAAILAVVLFHAELLAGDVTEGRVPVVHAVNGWLEPVRMPLLVALSGMLLAPALAKPTGRYVVGKLRSLAWPYLVWSAIDVAHLQWRLAQVGDSLPWSWPLRVLYAPPTYLWFLACLLVYYLVARLLPAPARTVAVPCLLVLAAYLPDHLDRLPWLGAWFLVGDVLGRAVRTWLVPREATGIDPLAYVGRSSLVFYASHLTVALAVSDRLAGAGARDPVVVLVACVVVPLVVGVVLVEARRWPVVDALFVAPFGAPAARPLRSSGAQADHRSLRPAG